MAHWLDNFDRAALIAKAVALGFDETQANLWLDRLLASRGGVKADKVAVRLAALDSLISDLTTQRDRTVLGRAWIVANAPTNAVKTATLASIDDILAVQLAQVRRLQNERNEIAGES